MYTFPYNLICKKKKKTFLSHFWQSDYIIKGKKILLVHHPKTKCTL